MEKVDTLNRRQKGFYGEDQAADYLVSQGYVIVNRNYQTKRGEIDCIATAPDGTLVFIEVKSARSLAYGNPLFRVTRAKQQQIAKMAQMYLKEHKFTSQKCRFDVIGIVGNKIDHLRNAFLT